MVDVTWGLPPYYVTEESNVGGESKFRATQSISPSVPPWQCWNDHKSPCSACLGRTEEVSHLGREREKENETVPPPYDSNLFRNLHRRMYVPVACFVVPPQSHDCATMYIGLARHDTVRVWHYSIHHRPERETFDGFGMIFDPGQNTKP